MAERTTLPPLPAFEFAPRSRGAPRAKYNLQACAPEQHGSTEVYITPQPVVNYLYMVACDVAQFLDERFLLW